MFRLINILFLLIMVAFPSTVPARTTSETWVPNPGPQTEALTRAEFELLFGGSRGGSKTETGIVWMAEPEYIANPRYAGLVIRKNLKDLSSWMQRAMYMYSCLGARRNKAENKITFPSGAYIQCGHLKDANAYEQWQGQEFQKVNVEELTQIPYEEWYLKLISSCRSTVPGLQAQVFCSANPGGPGHIWVRNRFVRKCRNKTFSYDHKLPDGRTIRRSRIFIPSKVEDTPQIMDNDPGYVVFLETLPTELRKAWRDGNWDVQFGQYFEMLNHADHVITPFHIPDTWVRYRSLDWGYNHHAVCIWWAVDYEGHAYIYRYLKVKGLTTRRLAQRIKEMSGTEKITCTLAGHDLWGHIKSDDHPTLKTYADIFEEEDVPLTKAIIDRILGWNAMRDGLAVEIEDKDGKLLRGKPSIQIFNTCEEIYNDWCILERDDRTGGNIEDVRKMTGDDAGDAGRYGYIHFTQSYKPESEKTPIERLIDSLPFDSEEVEADQNWENM